MTKFFKRLFRLSLQLWPLVRYRWYLLWNPFYFRLLGVEFGTGLKVHNKVYVQGRGKIRIGNDFHFTSGDSFNPICRNIRGSLFAATESSRIEIGDRVGISSACLWAKERITIGNDVNIGGDCIIMDNDAHPLDFLQRRKAFVEEVGQEAYNRTIGTAPVQIDDDVWIGARCMILKGVHIGARSVIAAGSVVTRSIPADVVAGGNPCRVLKEINKDSDK